MLMFIVGVLLHYSWLCRESEKEGQARGPYGLGIFSWRKRTPSIDVVERIAKPLGLKLPFLLLSEVERSIKEA
jgi:hypothetical protein